MDTLLIEKEEEEVANSNGIQMNKTIPYRSLLLFYNLLNSSVGLCGFVVLLITEGSGRSSFNDSLEQETDLCPVAMCSD